MYLQQTRTITRTKWKISRAGMAVGLSFKKLRPKMFPGLYETGFMWAIFWWFKRSIFHAGFQRPSIFLSLLENGYDFYRRLRQMKRPLWPKNLFLRFTIVYSWWFSIITVQFFWKIDIIFILVRDCELFLGFTSFL